MVSRLLTTMLLCVSLERASLAHAFCRETVAAQSEAGCSESDAAPPLFWDRSCFSYGFSKQVFSRIPMLSEAAVRDAFKSAFKAWASVDCGNERRARPFLVTQATSPTASDRAEFVYGKPNEAVVLVRSASEWAGLPDHHSSVLALTTLWHDKKTGEILDVDMELNGGAGAFADCEKSRCTGAMIDLQNTITHEAGHLLGLGHSTVHGSTMEKSTNGTPETSKRTLEADDERGYCALQLPAGPCADGACVCPAPPVFHAPGTSAASCSAPGRVSNAADRFVALCALAGLALGSWWLRMRARLRRALRPGTTSETGRARARGVRYTRAPHAARAHQSAGFGARSRCSCHPREPEARAARTLAQPRTKHTRVVG